MPSLLLVVFLIELFAHIVNTVGAAAVNNLLWNLYLSLPTQTAKDLAEKTKTQAEFLRVRKELNATSSQDQFAKWAKLRRQHDKLLDQLEKSKSSGDAIKSRFDSTVTAVRWTATSGIKFVLPLWYAKEPMFWLPQGWFPYYAEWVLSFPRAPLGSVSIASWQLACAGFIKLASDTLAAVLGLVMGAGTPTKQQQQQKQRQSTKTGAGDKKEAGAGPTPSSDAARSKKDS